VIKLFVTMLKTALILVALSAMAIPSFAATHRTQKKSSTTNSSRTSRKTKNSKHRVTASPRRWSQREPSPERYQEIQQALAAKGYYKGPVNGTWGPESAEALRRFQSDQNLVADGKIGSLSLIAMGLGPKRNLSAQSPAAQPQSQQ
jgi:peptidoglycan hydrolase-like protein with peptidoglycan-binding domain